MLTLSLWRHADFMKLWAGQTVSELGSVVTRTAVPLAAAAAPATRGRGLAKIGARVARRPRRTKRGNRRHPRSPKGSIRLDFGCLFAPGGHFVGMSPTRTP